MDEKKTMESLLDGFNAYEKFVNKEMHYVYLKNGSYHEIVFKAKKENFMHLCGVKYKDPKTKRILSANHFYNALKGSKISSKGIQKKPDGTTNQKLQVIKNLNDLTTCTVRVIDESTSYLNLSFDGALRSRRQVFCVALESIGKKTFIPSSLLNLKSSKGQTIKAGYPVHCIYSVDISTKNMHIVCKTPEFVQYEALKTYPYNSKLVSV